MMSESEAQGTEGEATPEAARARAADAAPARDRAFSGSGVSAGGPYANLGLFARIHRDSAPMLGLVALGVAAVALGLVGATALATWGVFIVCAILLVYALPIAFLDSAEPGRNAGAWGRKFVLATAFCGSAWAYLIVALLRSENPDAWAFAMLVMLLVSTVMSLLAATIPAAFVAGMAPMMIGVGLAYGARAHDRALPVAAMAAGVVCYFLVVVHRLRAAAARSLSLEAEKDALIAELEEARLNSDEARRRAESANLAKSRFLATMSHELRTPLNAILGFSEVMKGELFGPHGVAAYREYSNDIHVSGQHLLMLINEILDLSRVEAGRYELNEEAVSLAGVVEDCCRLLSMRARSRDLTLSQALDGTLPRLWVDDRAVRQIALNLLTNAIKFTPPGGSVSVSVGWTASGGQYLAIRDTGPGIPPEEIPVALSSFGRGSLAHKNAEEGSGLGLPIVKGLVELHGGQFRLASTVKQGTEAVVIFPAWRVMAEPPAARPETAPASEAPPRGRTRRRRSDPAEAA